MRRKGQLLGAGRNLIFLINELVMALLHMQSTLAEFECGLLWDWNNMLKGLVYAITSFYLVGDCCKEI